MSDPEVNKYSQSEIEAALYDTYHPNGQQIDRFIQDLIYQLLTTQERFDSNRPFGESSWEHWIEKAAQKLEPEAEVHGAGGNDEYKRAVRAILQYIFNAAEEKMRQPDEQGLDL